MKLRLRLALVSCVVALVAVGLTGAVLIRQSRAYSTEQLLQKQELLAQNRAFALGDSLDVNQNVYTQSAVSKRQTAVNTLENSLNGVQMEFTVSTDSVSY